MADFSDDVRYPIFGGLAQPSAGTARHDAWLGVMRVKQIQWCRYNSKL